MRFRKFAKWDDSSSCKGLAYFAQMLEEMLFDFSLDTYKPSVMQTGSMCFEALNAVEEIAKGNIKAANLDHICDELCHSFDKDLVAQDLVPLSLRDISPILLNPKASIDEKKAVLELLNFNLRAPDYRKRNEELLRDAIVNFRDFDAIRRLGRTYITTLLAIGYDPKYLHETALEYFYFGPNRIISSECVDGFLSLFPKEKREFNIVFKVGEIFNQIPAETDRIGIKILKDLPSDMDAEQYALLEVKGDKPNYAVALKRVAKDPRSAANSALKSLKLCATLLTLFHHKSPPEWQEKCVVHDIVSGKYHKVSAGSNSMHKCADLRPNVASQKLRLLLTDFNLEQESFSKFIRSVQLHSMALGSNADENQLLNLWISMESLIPSETKGENSSNIEHITDSMIPFLSCGYLERLMNNLVKDLLRWDRELVLKVFKKVEVKKFTHKLVRIMVLPEFAQLLHELRKSIADFYLLSDRFEYFVGLFSSPQNVLTALDAHNLRLKWQIRRIYRFRNLIVHSGTTPPYTKTIIEHAHDYLDIVLASLVKLASHPRSISSVGQGFKFMALKHIAYRRSLSQKGLKFDSGNLEALVFGSVH